MNVSSALVHSTIAGSATFNLYQRQFVSRGSAAFQLARYGFIHRIGALSVCLFNFIVRVLGVASAHKSLPDADIITN
jgi:hypothetical protein